MKRSNSAGEKKDPNRATQLYGHHACVAYAKALPARAAEVNQQHAAVNSIFERLLADENFITLLRAESMTAIPACLKSVLRKERQAFQ